MGLHATFTLDPDVAQKMAAELQGQVAVLTYHPAGCCGFFPGRSSLSSPIYLPFHSFQIELSDGKSSLTKKNQSPRRTRQQASGNVDLVADPDGASRRRLRGLEHPGGDQKCLERVRGVIRGAVPFGFPFAAGGCGAMVREAGAVAHCGVGWEKGDGDFGGGCGSSYDLS